MGHVTCTAVAKRVEDIYWPMRPRDSYRYRADQLRMVAKSLLCKRNTGISRIVMKRRVFIELFSATRLTFLQISQLETKEYA